MITNEFFSRELMNEPVQLPDIKSRQDLVQMVDAFYEKVRADPRLGHVFDEVAQVHWETHLPKLYDFWDSVMFRAGTFRGNPIAAHVALAAHTDMGRALFDRWLELLRETVLELFAGENAEHLIRCAEDMANVIHSKIHGAADGRFAPSCLTAEQRARYALYRASA